MVVRRTDAQCCTEEASVVIASNKIVVWNVAVDVQDDGNSGKSQYAFSSVVNNLLTNTQIYGN